MSTKIRKKWLNYIIKLLEECSNVDFEFLIKKQCGELPLNQISCRWIFFYLFCIGQTWVKKLEVRASENAPSFAAQTDVFGSSSLPPLPLSSSCPPSSVALVSAAGTDSLPA